MKLSFFITLGILTNIFYSSSALGDDLVLDAEVSSDDVAVLYGSACEKINSQEPKSSVRIRATDKASFDAVKNLSDLSEFKSQYNEHDFNVLVYNIVDNYIDDLTVRTTKQDDKEICVEVTGYVKKADILSSINHDENKDAEKNIVADNNRNRY